MRAKCATSPRRAASWPRPTGSTRRGSPSLRKPSVPRGGRGPVRESDKLRQQVPGLGRVVPAVLLALLPELGRLSPKKIAALVGVCPFNRESGRWNGKRAIFGGRAGVRSVLYMAIVSAIRWNPLIKSFSPPLLA